MDSSVAAASGGSDAVLLPSERSADTLPPQHVTYQQQTVASDVSATGHDVDTKMLLLRQCWQNIEDGSPVNVDLRTCCMEVVDSISNWLECVDQQHLSQSEPQLQRLLVCYTVD